MSEEAFIQWRFKKGFGYVLNLEHPRTFNEKIQWLKLHDRTPLHTRCADKYAVRQYVAEKVGAEYLVPLLYHTENPADITPENLPEPPFIVKTSHASFGGIIVRDKVDLDCKTLRKTLARQMKVNYYFRSKEWQYRNIKPRIMVEQLIESKDGVVPTDYKIYCFHGEPRFIQMITGRYVDTRECFYDIDWSPLNFRLTYPFIKVPPNKPERLSTMLDVAATLSSDFCYARIDLYHEYGKVYFGEITHHPDSGFSMFDPPVWDRKLGNMLILPNGKNMGEGNR